MKRSCDFASEQQEVRRRAAFDMRGISLRNVPVSRSSSVPLRGRFSVFRVCRRRNLRHQRVDWTYRGQPDGDAARCGQDNWMEADTHPCAALGARRPTGHTRSPARGVPTGHTRSPAREGPAPPSARDVRQCLHPSPLPQSPLSQHGVHGGAGARRRVGGRRRPDCTVISTPQMRE